MRRVLSKSETASAAQEVGENRLQASLGMMVDVRFASVGDYHFPPPPQHSIGARYHHS
jgi:hypothetical protein